MLWWNAIQLRFGDADKRRQAVQLLGMSKDPRAIKHLATALRDKDIGTREQAVQALGRVGAVQPLIRALGDESWHVQGAAVRALEAIGDERAIGPLVALLKERRSLACKEVPDALTRIGKEKAVEPLLEALKDTLHFQVKDIPKAAISALGKIGDSRAIEPLCNALKDQDAEVQEAAMEALRKIDPHWAESEKGSRMVSELAVSLKDADWRVRKAAAGALAQVAGPQHGKALAAAVSDKDSDVRALVVKALKRIGWKPQDTDEAIRWCLAEQDWKGLSGIGGPAFEFCLNAAQAGDRATREPAIKALCQFTDSNAATRVEALLARKYGTAIREEVFQQILASERLPLDRAALCVKYLRDKDLRHYSARYLGKVGGLKHLQPLLDYLLDGGAVWNQELVTSLGNTLLRSQVGGNVRDAIRKCMEQLASGGNEEAAAILYQLRRGT